MKDEVFKLLMADYEIKRIVEGIRKIYAESTPRLNGFKVGYSKEVEETVALMNEMIEKKARKVIEKNKDYLAMRCK